MNIAKFSVKNSVLVNLLMVLILVFGIVALSDIPQELFSDFSFQWVFISTVYPGVSPSEIEKLITIPIEDQIANVSGIKSVASSSMESASFLSIQFEEMSDRKFDKRFQELKDEVDKVTDLPDDAEDPTVLNFGTADFMPMITVVIGGDIPERELKFITEDLQDEILRIRNVSKAELGGVRDREIWVEADPERLESYNLTVSDVVNAIRMKNMNVPGGTMKIGRDEYILRTIGEFNKVDEVSNIIIRTNNFDGTVNVNDVSRVSDTFEDPDILSRLDGKSCMTISVSKNKEGNSIDIIDEIKKVVEKYKSKLPAGVTIKFTNDQSVFIKDSLNDLKNNAWIGLIAVILILYFMLGPRFALFAGLGIPISFFITFIFMRYYGESLNGNTMFGLVLVLGIIVDDAIIVVENCFRYMQKGYKTYKAVVIGTREVFMPVFASTLTTVAAFLPLMIMPGIMGKFMRMVPIIVSLALVASLFESFVILPAHIADWTKSIKIKPVSKTSVFFRIRRRYRKTLGKFLRRRYLVLGSVFLMLIFSFVLVVYIEKDLYSSEEVPFFMVDIRMPEGTKFEETEKTAKQIEKKVLLLPEDEVKSVVCNTGMTMTDEDWVFNPDVAQISVDLVKRNNRERSMNEIIGDLRGRLTDIVGVKSIELRKMNNGPPVGSPVEIRVSGKYFSELVEVVELVKDELGSMPGVVDIRDDYNIGKKELQVKIDEDKAALLGLDVTRVAGNIRMAFEGATATVYRDGDDEIDVIVKYKKDRRENYTDLSGMKIYSRQGYLVPLEDIARVETIKGVSKIQRWDRERTITITANVEAGVTSSYDVNSEIEKKFEDISKRFPGYKIDFGGEFQEFREAFDNIGKLFLIGIFLIYLILGGQFRSFLQPLVIMFTVPFAFIGAVFGLFVNGYPFSITSLYGIVALSGIAVNDALVLITFINNSRRIGVPRWRSIIDAGQKRLRPILLTSITTICGLAPMALGIGGKSLVWAPLASTIIWGLFFSTVLTLLFIPCIYSILDDVKYRLFKMRYTKEAEEYKEFAELEAL